jgi:hypothetical protein
LTTLRKRNIMKYAIKVILAVLVLSWVANSWGKDQLWVQKWLTSNTISDTIEGNDIPFVCEYQIVKRTMLEDEMTRSEPKTVGDTVFFSFSTIDAACAYSYRVDVAGNSIRFEQECDPVTEGKSISSFSVYVKIYNLKKGAYYFNYGEGCKRVAINNQVEEESPIRMAER